MSLHWVIEIRLRPPRINVRASLHRIKDSKGMSLIPHRSSFRLDVKDLSIHVNDCRYASHPSEVIAIGFGGGHWISDDAYAGVE